MAAICYHRCIKPKLQESISVNIKFTVPYTTMFEVKVVGKLMCRQNCIKNFDTPFNIEWKTKVVNNI